MSTGSLFRKPFSPKKAPARKATTISPLQMDAAERSREFGLDYNHAHMYLGNQHFKFDSETGEWFDDVTGQHYRYQFGQSMQTNNQQKSNQGNSKEVQKLQKNQQQLQEENNMLKVKNDILVDMIAEVYSEFKLETDKRKKK